MFLIFDQNIVRGKTGVYMSKHNFLIFALKHRLWVLVRIAREPVLTNTHDLCFRAKIRKIMYTPVNHSFTI